MTEPVASHPAVANGSYDVVRVRQDFPILSKTVYGKPLVYLDNAATSWPKPPEVIAAMQAYLENGGGSPHSFGPYSWFWRWP